MDVKRRVMEVTIGLALICAPACSVRMNWPEHQLTVALELDAAQGQMMFVDATPLQVEHAYLVYDSVELLTCEELERPSLPGFGWREVLTSAAWAHGPTTPTRIGETRVVSLTDRERVELGSFAPPPGEYCGVRVVIRAADDDAVGREDAAVDMLGQSAWLRAVDASGEEVFVARTSSSTDVLLEFEEPWSFGQREDIEAEVVFTQRLPARMSAEHRELEEDARGKAWLVQAREELTMEVRQ